MELEMLPLTKRIMIAAPVALAAITSPLVTFPARATAASSIDAPRISQLQRGDLVRLRSGGPLMTVNQIEGDQVDCFWTDWNGQPNDAKFPAHVLQKL
jgi:uncharacterized protein YodC (DUF2158 family)